MKSKLELMVEEKFDFIGEDANMSRYLVVVLEEFCLDGQIVSSEYAIDREDSDFVDINDYDKRDFFGDFSLGVFEGLNEELVIEDVARSYDFEGEMLKAYKLASKWFPSCTLCYLCEIREGE